ncbi:MAG: transcriptional regulator, Crp/Fnr family [Burkholderiales bacterium]|jgi:CRP/FNR family transcriptional regulator|nr:transcriptional regulator, Crp/Fnr family [Burkholderiales bacterium]
MSNGEFSRVPIMPSQPRFSAIDVRRLKAACSTCSLRELCLPAGLDEHELEKVDCMVKRRRPVRRGDRLYRSGAALDSLYAVRTGFMKSCVLHDDGREQVAGFHMMGDVIGLDAISSGRHLCDVMALEDSEVCEIPLARLQCLARDIPALQQHFHRILSREIVRDHGVMLLLGTMRAEERLAVFLLNLSQRFAARGYSPREFYLRMTREEIGSYLGLKLETISRALSRFHEQKLIEVRTKRVKILDMEALREMIGLRGCPD